MRSPGYPIFRHGAYTPAGTLERWEAFATGLRRATGPARWLVQLIRVAAAIAVTWVAFRVLSRFV